MVQKTSGKPKITVRNSSNKKSLPGKKNDTCEKDNRALFSGLIDFYHALSLPIILIFIASWAFLAYSFNMFSQSLGILLLFVILTWLFSLIIKETKSAKEKWIIVFFIVFFTVIIVRFYQNLLWIWIIFAAWAAITRLSLMYFLKCDRKYSYIRIFISIIISLMISFAITVGLYLFYAYVFIQIFDTVLLIVLFLLAATLIFVLFFLFTLISANLIKMVLGNFDFDSYFLFKHLPMKIFNGLVSKTKDIKQSALRLSLIISGIAIILCLIGGAIFGIIYTERTYSGINDVLDKTLFLNLYFSSANKYSNIIELKGYDSFKLSPIYYSEEGKLKYNEEDINDTQEIFYNCNNNVVCESKPFIQGTKLEDQIDIKRDNIYYSARKGEEKALFVLTAETKEETIKQDIFEFKGEDLEQTEIAAELNQRWKSALENSWRYERLKPGTWLESAYLFYSGEVFQIEAMFYFNYSISASELAQVTSLQKIVIQEYTDISKNTTFYDGTASLIAHAQALRNSIDELYSRMSHINYENNERDFFSDMFNSDYWQWSLCLKSWEMIFKHLPLNAYYTDLKDKMGISQNDYKDDIMENYIMNNKKFGSGLDSILKMKILQTQMASYVSSYCGSPKYPVCKDYLARLIWDPSFCDSDECIFNVTRYDKGRCDLLNYPGQAEACRVNSAISS